MRRAGAFDIQAVCSGFAYALSIADSMIRAGSAKRVLVIGAETLSRVLDWKDRTTCVLFGDGAGAVVLEKSDEPGILASELKADGTRGVHVLAADSHIDGGKVVGDPFIRMDGRLVFKAAVEKNDGKRSQCTDQSQLGYERRGSLYSSSGQLAHHEYGSRKTRY